jgi:hypothetical protein
MDLNLHRMINLIEKNCSEQGQAQGHALHDVSVIILR